MQTARKSSICYRCGHEAPTQLRLLPVTERGRPAWKKKPLCSGCARLLMRKTFRARQMALFE